MKSKILLFVLTAFMMSAFAQSPVWKWANSMGGSGTEIVRAVTDDMGNTYVTGGFSSANMSVGTTNLSSNGDYDIFIAKYDAGGNALWAKSFGSPQADNANGIIADGNGNIYVSGNFSGSFSFGGTTVTSNGDLDFFLAKMDGNGNVIWVQTAGGSNYEYGGHVDIDNNGDLYVTGYYKSSSVIFGSQTILKPGSSDDIYVVKYDNNGNCLWAKTFGGNGSDFGWSVKADNMGGVHIASEYQSDIINFGSVTLDNMSWWDIYLVKLNASDGSVLWGIDGLSGGQYDKCSDLDIDADGNAYITGIFEGATLDFGTTSLNSNGGEEAFAAKFDKDGNLVWAKSIGAGGNDHAFSCELTSSGELLATGYFSGTVAFGSGNLASNGMKDAFFAKFDTGGNIIWSESIGGNDDDEGWAISADAMGNYYLAGNYKSGSLSFDATTLNNAASGTNDIFVARLCYPPATPSISQSGFDLTCSASGTGIAYQWYLNGSVIGGATAQAYTAVADGAYTVEVNNGCSTAMSDSLNITGTALFEVKNTAEISIYPNPFSEKAELRIENAGAGYGNRTLKIYDILGKEVKHLGFNDNKAVIERGNLTAGIYFYAIVSDTYGIISKGKMVVE